MTEYRAEHVGSLLRPPELLSARSLRAAGLLSATRLGEIEDQAVLAALDLQREAGLRVFTDGEFRRGNFMAGIMESVGGLVPVDRDTSFQPAWHRGPGDGEPRPPAAETDLPAVAVGERLYRKVEQSTAEAAFLIKHSPGQFKITIVSPTMGAQLWCPGVTDRVYATRADMLEDFVRLQIHEVRALVAAGVTWIQLDSLAYIPYVDERQRARSLARGVDVDARLDQLIQIDNALVRAAKECDPAVVVGMHFCRGNNRSAWTAAGGYEPIAERLFADVCVDRLLLEFDTERAGGFEPLRFVPPGRTVVLGLVSSKTPALESADELRRRIDAAAKYLPFDQLALSPQCGFASTARGNLLTLDDQRRKLELVAETARAVWG
ncbi:MAG TPA: cobalamin-independent methionine synthase II family protein [Streptosporangiaceae bacterium]|nr:cobalamin-independent methionine synthase II family protein [Streptosporangiaceae bacterium]